jgi:hypothetical protein
LVIGSGKEAATSPPSKIPLIQIRAGERFVCIGSGAARRSLPDCKGASAALS